jgi:hypothetical protein
MSQQLHSAYQPAGSIPGSRVVERFLWDLDVLSDELRDASGFVGDRNRSR